MNFLNEAKVRTRRRDLQADAAPALHALAYLIMLIEP